MTSDEIVTHLAEIVGSTHLSGVDADLEVYGNLEPELVVWPAAAREVAQVLQACAQASAKVGVVGGRTRARDWATRALVALNTRRMADILDIDETSLTVHAQAGIRLRHLEDALRRQGLTLGYFRAGRQQGSTLGGALATPLGFTHSPLHGRLVDNCIAVSVACLDGKVLHTPVVPRSATGPDIKWLHLGAGGRLGVITAAVLRAHRLPEAELPVVHLYDNLPRALAAARRILARAVRPARLEVLNEARAMAEVGDRGFPMPALCVSLLAGAGPLVDAQAQVLGEVVREFDGSELPQQLADTWWQEQLRHDEAPTAELDAAADDTLPDRSLRGYRVRYSSVSSTLAALERMLGDQPLAATPVWIDNLSLHGGVLWLEDPAGATTTAEGLDELEAAPPPLVERLRSVVDPGGILVAGTLVKMGRRPADRSSRGEPS